MTESPQPTHTSRWPYQYLKIKSRKTLSLFGSLVNPKPLGIQNFAEPHFVVRRGPEGRLLSYIVIGRPPLHRGRWPRAKSHLERDLHWLHLKATKTLGPFQRVVMTELPRALALKAEGTRWVWEAVKEAIERGVNFYVDLGMFLAAVRDCILRGRVATVSNSGGSSLSN